MEQPHSGQEGIGGMSEIMKTGVTGLFARIAPLKKRLGALERRPDEVGVDTGRNQAGDQQNLFQHRLG